MTPLVLNPVPVTSCWDVFAPAYEPTEDTMDPTPRLPTPEERMRQQAEAVAADIVPINVTGRTLIQASGSVNKLDFETRLGLYFTDNQTVGLCHILI